MAQSGESQGGEFTSAFGEAAELHGRMASAAFDANDPERKLATRLAQQTVSRLRQHAAVVAAIPRPSAFAALSDCTSHRRRKPIFAIVHASGLKRSVGQLFCGQDENLGSRL